ncbi:MAG: proteasome alpha subunit [Verrucomicrobiales bacterium]|jgi:proteasome alpha subunit
MSGELFQWLEAIRDRGEYVRDQLSHATPVFAVSRPEGILLVGVGLGQSKIFEIYDRHAVAALGNPVDIEKIRQTAIEAAHLEGFNRSPQDVTLRRLMSYSLSPALKTSFESVFEPPLIVNGVFAEVGATPEQDMLMEFSHDGNFTAVNDGLSVVSANDAAATQAKIWLKERLKPHANRNRTLGLLLAMWQAMSEGRRIGSDIKALSLDNLDLQGRIIEMALLDRRASGKVKYQALSVDG